jgi:Ca2+-transporting ATPase
VNYRKYSPNLLPEAVPRSDPHIFLDQFKSLMSAASIYVAMRRIRVTDGKFLAETGWLAPFACDELLRLLHVAVLCNETEVSRHEGEYVLKGSSAESALLQMAISAGVDVMQLRAQYPLLHVNPRAEQRNFLGSMHAMHADGRLAALSSAA